MLLLVLYEGRYTVRLFTLSPRLRAVADQIPEGARMADIGTDHAHLPVWLWKQGKLQSAIATDVRKGPLSRAQTTAERFGVAEKMSFRLCDGLSGLQPDEVDTIVIAGMGGETILQILEAAPWLCQGDYTLLLQPMSSLPDLRKWLSQHQFSIQKERIVREGNSLYTIMLVKPGMEEHLTVEEQWLGRMPEDPLRKDYLQMLMRRYQKVLSGLNDSQAPGDALRKAELEQVCAAIEAELNAIGGKEHADHTAGL